MKEPLAYSAVELAGLLGVSEWQVRRQAKAGLIPSMRVGGRVLFPRKAILEWLDDSVRDSATPTSTASE